MRFPGFIGPSYTLQSVNVDCQRAVNLFPEINALGTGKDKEVAALVPTPGKRLLLALPNSPVRGLWRASNDQLFAVAGSKLYSISSSWVATELGSLSTTAGAVSIADNGTHLVIVDGLYGYVWNLKTSAFNQISDPNFYPSDTVTFLDGYLLFNKSGTAIVFFSGLYAVTFSALDYFTAEGSPDKLIGIVASNQTIYAFGAQSTEFYYDSGSATNTFVRINGAVNGTGCYAAQSIAKINGVPYFLGGDDTGCGVIYRMRGYQAERISTSAIESVIRGLNQTTLATSRAWTYQQGGHSFYCINLTGAASTWVFDDSTSLWHERTYLNLWSQERDRADCHAVFAGLNVVGDYSTGAIYALDQAYYTDNGTSIVRSRTAPHTSQDMNLIRHNRFQLDMEVGVGLDGVAQGTNPQAMLQWSDDGGHTWSNERWADIGKIGKTKTRVIWRRLGMSRDRVYKVTITDPIKVTLIGADMDLEEGTA